MSIYQNIEHSKKLWLLVILAEKKSFSEAARIAGVTPSAVSQSITTLEAIFGFALVVRINGKVEMTPAALQIIALAKPSLTTLGNLFMQKEREQIVPQLRIGAYDSIALVIVPQILAETRKEGLWPRISVRVGRSSELAKMVRQGEINFAVVSELDEYNRLEACKLASDGLGFFYNPIEFPEIPNEVDKKTLLHLPIGSIQASRSGHPLYFQRFIKCIFENSSNINFLCESFETLGEAASRGALVAVLPTQVAARFPKLVKLSVSDCPDELGTHGIYLISYQHINKSEFEKLSKRFRQILNANGYKSATLVD